MASTRWLAIVALACTAAAPAQRERLLSPPLDGFVVGFEAANADQSIREEIPAGETVQAWTRMATTQRFIGLARNADPDRYVRAAVGGLDHACPAAKVGAVEPRKVSGRTAAQVSVDCPLLAATGKPESFVLLAVAGQADMLVKQFAFRRVPSAQDRAFAAAFLAATRWCPAGKRDAQCVN